MTQAVATRQTSEIASIDALLAERAAAILDKVKPGTKTISLNNRQFNMPGGEVVNGPLDLIVLDYAFQYRYYADPYQMGQTKPVTCYAIGDSEEAMVIGTDVAHPVHNNCNSCPNNQWGSAGAGRKGKACHNNLLLAVMLPDLDDSKDVMVIKASPAALTGVKQYLANATRLFGHPLKAITTASIQSAGGGFKLVLEVSQENPRYKEHATYLDEAHTAVRSSPSVGFEELEFATPSVKRAKD